MRCLSSLCALVLCSCAGAQDVRLAVSTTAPGPTAPPVMRVTRDFSSDQKVAEPRLLASVEIAAVGDVMAHGPVVSSASSADRRTEDGISLNNGGFDALFEGIQGQLSGADLAFANLEAPVAPITGKRRRAFSFNAPVQLLRALGHAGIDVVSFANNHVYDQGRKGLVETLRHAQAWFEVIGAGLTCAKARRATILRIKGIKVGLLATTALLNKRGNAGRNKPCVSMFDLKQVLQAVAEARTNGADVVVLSIHWGKEYRVRPSKKVIDLAHRLLEGGVDVILGHHPHVLQPVEVYRTSDGRITLAAYSLGNLISNQARFYVHGLHPSRTGNPRDGAILRFRVVQKDYGQGVIRTELADLSVEPLWTQNNALDRIRDKRLAPIIRVVANDAELARLQPLLRQTRDQGQIVELTRNIEKLRTRRGVVASVVGPGLLPDISPSPS